MEAAELSDKSLSRREEEHPASSSLMNLTPWNGFGGEGTNVSPLLNQVLIELDKLEPYPPVVVLATSYRPERLAAGTALSWPF